MINLYGHDYFFSVDCEKAINRLQAELDKHRWIPVEERLPEEDGYYLAAEDGRFGEYWYSGLGSWMHGDRRTPYNCADRITHWKPIILPEQAKKGIEP